MKEPIAKLSDIQRRRIQTRHKVSVELFGYQPKGLYWSNREIQEIRFDILLSLLPKAADLKPQAWSLLDVGCGFADLFNYLQRFEYFPQYTGIDVSPQVIAGATSTNPQAHVLEGELFDFDFIDNQFDFVMLSGALNEVVETEVEGSAGQQGEYAKSVIKSMYRLCSRGVAFNLLDSRNKWVKSRFDLQSFDPEEIVSFCQEFADEVELVDSYLENDFTIFLRKVKE